MVINIAYAPGWHAYVNGKAAPIDRANFAFMATEVGKGTSTIWFIYSPLTSLISFFLSLLFLFSLFWFNPATRKSI